MDEEKRNKALELTYVGTTTVRRTHWVEHLRENVFYYVSLFLYHCLLACSALLWLSESASGGEKAFYIASAFGTIVNVGCWFTIFVLHMFIKLSCCFKCSFAFRHHVFSELLPSPYHTITRVSKRANESGRQVLIGLISTVITIISMYRVFRFKQNLNKEFLEKLFSISALGFRSRTAITVRVEFFLWKYQCMILVWGKEMVSPSDFSLVFT